MKFSIPQTLENIATILGCDFVGDSNFAVLGMNEIHVVEPGDIVFVEVDTEGESLDMEEVFGTIEAVKTVSDLFMPITGEVTEFNETLEDEPELINSSPYEKLRKDRYESFDSGKGKAFEAGQLSMEDLYKIAKENGELSLKSGKQELFENIINQYI